MTSQGVWLKSTAYCSHFSLLQCYKNDTALHNSYNCCVVKNSDTWFHHNHLDNTPRRAQRTSNLNTNDSEPRLCCWVIPSEIASVLTPKWQQSGITFQADLVHPLLNSPLQLRIEATTKFEERGLLQHTSVNHPHIHTVGRPRERPARENAPFSVLLSSNHSLKPFGLDSLVFSFGWSCWMSISIIDPILFFRDG